VLGQRADAARLPDALAGAGAHAHCRSLPPPGNAQEAQAEYREARAGAEEQLDAAQQQ
jgi:hypothetical protein